jgi:hypothetical protein
MVFPQKRHSFCQLPGRLSKRALNPWAFRQNSIYADAGPMPAFFRASLKFNWFPAKSPFCWPAAWPLMQAGLESMGFSSKSRVSRRGIHACFFHASPKFMGFPAKAPFCWPASWPLIQAGHENMGFSPKSRVCQSYAGTRFGFSKQALNSRGFLQNRHSVCALPGRLSKWALIHGFLPNAQP